MDHTGTSLLVPAFGRTDEIERRDRIAKARAVGQNAGKSNGGERRAE